MKSINISLQQLEYIVAVDTFRHFRTAADECYVTQPTLSMMIQKLEDELGVQVFDRSKKPVVPTEAGEEIITQARKVLQEVRGIYEVVQAQKGEIKGTLRLGVIPTLAPYLLPLFLDGFLKKYPQVKLKVSEQTTGQITRALESQQLDAGILATPLDHEGLQEQVLFYERFVVYSSSREKLLKKQYITPADLDLNRLWLLEEGHCLRSQVVNLCALRKKDSDTSNLEYEAGSIETLKKMVQMHEGVTIIPELAINDLTKAEKLRIRYFRSPAPVREISLVTYRHFVKKRLLEALQQEILRHIPKEMISAKGREVVDIGQEN